MAGEQGEWRDRVEALKREKPAQLAMLAAIVAALCALLAWTFVLLPSGRDIRGQPLFWLMALPAMVWMGALQNHSAWAVRTLPFALAAAPLLSLAALLAAPEIWTGSAADRLATPLAMRMILGVTAALALAGAVALRRSSLPGGGRPARFLPPGSVPAMPAISARARGALMIGSLALSGTLINGVLFSIVTILPAEEADPTALGTPWPAVIPVALAAFTFVPMVRGALRLQRGDRRALRDLPWSWRIGATGTGLMVPLAWIWPGPAAAKAVFSAIMLPMALAAAWAAHSARRRLDAARETSTSG